MGLFPFLSLSFAFSISFSLSLSLPLSDSFLLQVMFHTLTNWKNKQPMITYSLPKRKKKLHFPSPFVFYSNCPLVCLFVCFFLLLFFFQLIICVLKMSFVLYKRGRSRRRARKENVI